MRLIRCSAANHVDHRQVKSETITKLVPFIIIMSVELPPSPANWSSSIPATRKEGYECFLSHYHYHYHHQSSRPSQISESPSSRWYYKLSLGGWCLSNWKLNEPKMYFLSRFLTWLFRCHLFCTTSSAVQLLTSRTLAMVGLMKEDGQLMKSNLLTR